MICLFFLFFSWEENDPARTYQQPITSPSLFCWKSHPPAMAPQFLFCSLWLREGDWRSQKQPAGAPTQHREQGGSQAGPRIPRHWWGKSSPRLANTLKAPVSLLYTKHTSSGKCPVPAWQSESPGRQKGNESFCII